MKNKFKDIFSKVFKKKNNEEIEEVNEEQEEGGEESADNYYMDGGVEELQNTKQREDLAKNKRPNNLSLLKSLSLQELTLLEKELEFNYDYLDYNVLNVARTKDFFLVKCEIVDSSGIKKMLKLKIMNKAKKEDWEI